MITLEMPYSYRTNVTGIPAIYAGMMAGVEADKDARWGDIHPMLADDGTGAGTLGFSFKWEPLEAGPFTLTVSVFEDPMRFSPPRVEGGSKVMEIKVAVDARPG